ncbi:rCG22959 [Rattus norvegicus]|uniref:RCG22959 n=1 Tax=Rattus norvegicus TaxID=10116 RepID=A6KB22_RAT|nr:rCG22959 [Rattus norvegicus]
MLCEFQLDPNVLPAVWGSRSQLSWAKAASSSLCFFPFQFPSSF